MQAQGIVYNEFPEMGAQMSPLGRLGQPADIADVVAFLVSEEDICRFADSTASHVDEQSAD